MTELELCQLPRHSYNSLFVFPWTKQTRPHPLKACAVPRNPIDRTDIGRQIRKNTGKVCTSPSMPA